MPRYFGSDPYVDPATGVLKNRLGIMDETILERTEADIVAARSYELSKAPLQKQSIVDAGSPQCGCGNRLEGEAVAKTIAPRRVDQLPSEDALRFRV